MNWRVVTTLLQWRWSPQQIAATLKRVFPQQPERHVSHETIYTTIYAHPKGELRRELIALLRRRHSKRMPRSRGEDRRGQIPDMVSIHVRPPESEDRAMRGHWEGDLTKARSAGLLWVCWWSAAAAWSCWHGCPMPRPYRRWPRSR